MSDPETPLVFTFLNEHGGPVLFALAVIFASMALQSPVLTGVVAGPLFIWLVVRVLNRRDDPRRQRADDELPDAPTDLD